MIFIFLLSIFLISAVNASELNETEEITAVDEVDDVVIAEDDPVPATEHNVSGNTFSDIQKVVNNAKDDESIVLSGKYSGNGNPIDVSNKKITFLGTNGATLDAKGKSHIVEGLGGAVFKNIRFINGYNEDDNGGAIFSADAVNCTFENCQADCGGAIYEGNAVNCTFIKCKANSGGAIYSGDAENCKFLRCEAKTGGAMTMGNAKNCVFEWCDIVSASVIKEVEHSGCTFKNIDPKFTASDMAVYYTAESYFKVRITSNSKPVSGVAVKFLINGKNLASKTTDSNGWAKVKISKIPGSYKITAQAIRKSVTKKVTVKHIVSLKTLKIKKSAKKLVLSATIKVGKTPVKNKKVTFVFNGRKYFGKTNKKGVAKAIIKKGVLKKLKVGKKVKYRARYLKDIVNKTAKVSK